MSISKSKLVVGASIAVAALGLVGSGAGATFSDSVFSSQKVQVGSFGVRIDPVASDGFNTDDHHVTLNQVGPLASTFHTIPEQVRVTNTGNVVAHTYRLSLDYATDDANLSNVWIKLTSYNPTASTPGSTADTIFEGSIADFKAHPVTVVGDLTPAGTAQDYDAYNVEFYTPNGFSLDNADEGQSITPTVEAQYIG